MVPEAVADPAAAEGSVHPWGVLPSVRHRCLFTYALLLAPVAIPLIRALAPTSALILAPLPGGRKVTFPLLALVQLLSLLPPLLLLSLLQFPFLISPPVVLGCLVAGRHLACARSPSPDLVNNTVLASGMQP